jgi:hypothetical protein
MLARDRAGGPGYRVQHPARAATTAQPIGGPARWTNGRVNSTIRSS